jgi:secreted PhoX family phosphatase
MLIDTADDRVSNPSHNPSLNELIDQAVSRRRLLKGGLGALTLALFGCGSDDEVIAAPAPAPVATPPVATPQPPAEQMLGFAAVAASSADTVVVPAGYAAQAFLPWGEPLFVSAPGWAADASQGWQAQEQQVGDNHDGMHFFGFNAAGNGPGDRSDEGLLAINHEYINPEYFYAPGSDPADWLAPFTFDKVRKALAGHGISVVHIKRGTDGTWSAVKNSPYTRRITGYTPMTLTGPAAGAAALQTADDPAGTSVLGTLNNCANGFTPWGTYLTCEENFNGYFGWNGTRTASALENRYGLSESGFGYRWHTADARFDLAVTPNEPNRFGWVVEIDPFAPGGTPVKHTALGRFKHENAELVVAPDGRVVVYMGDDERNEYIYKFVSSGTFDRANPQAPAHRSLLTDGTLYVAKFEAGATAADNAGTGVWIPLVYGQNGLDSSNGFDTAADLLIRTRQAADRLGATMMDRPEWIAANPKKAGEVYIALTNNNRRGSSATPSSNKADGSTVAGSARPAVDDANPRTVNNWGHIVRWNEAGGNPTATTFTWDIFIIAGNPSVYSDARRGTANITAANMFNSPDGLAFDSFGRLWIETDGSFANSGDFAGMGNNQMLAADPVSGEVRRFLVGPSGCEITGLTFTPDRKTLFCNIQHPGEVGSHPNAPADYLAQPAAARDNWIARNASAFSKWPDGADAARPRSAVVVVRRTDGGVIGG